MILLTNKYMNLKHYILDEKGDPKVEPDLLTWARWFETAPERIIKQTEVKGIKISSIFLGLDHNFGNDENELILWETMAWDNNVEKEIEWFGGKKKTVHPDIFQSRYSSKVSMLAEHDRLVENIKNGKDINNYN